MGDRAPPRRGRAGERPHRRARHRPREEEPPRVGARPRAAESLRHRRRRRGAPVLRGGEERQAQVRRDEPRFPVRDERAQRPPHPPGPRRRGRVLQPSCAPPLRGGDGWPLRSPVPEAPSPFLRGADSRVRDGEELHRHDARVFRRLHVLQHHRARGPHHPVPLGGQRAPRGEGPVPHGGIQGHHHRRWRPDGQHVQDAVQGRADRERLSPPLLRPPRRLREPPHRPRPPRRSAAKSPAREGHQEGLHRLRHPLRSGGAEPRVHPGARGAPHGRPALRGPRAHQPGRARQDEEARDRELRAVRAGLLSGERGRRQRAVPHPLFHHRTPGLDLERHHRAGPLPEAPEPPPAPGARLHPHAHGHRHGDVPHGGGPADERACLHGDGPPREADDEGAHLLVGRGELASRARGPQEGGPRGSGGPRPPLPGAARLWPHGAAGEAACRAPPRAWRDAPGDASRAAPGDASRAAPGDASRAAPGDAWCVAPCVACGNTSWAAPGHAPSGRPAPRSGYRPAAPRGAGPGRRTT